MTLAAIAAAAFALPLGIMIGGRGTPAPQAPSNASLAEPLLQARTRDRWDPALLQDPHVLAEQQRVVEAMERGCAIAGEGCTEAATARRQIDARIRAAR